MPGPSAKSTGLDPPWMLSPGRLDVCVCHSGFASLQSTGSLVVVVVVSASALGIGTLLSYRDFDPLCGEALAQSCALADTRELLSREDLEGIAKDGRQDWRFTGVDSRVTIYRAIGRLHTHVDKRKSEPIRSRSASDCAYNPKDKRGEGSPHTKLTGTTPRFGR